MGSGRVGTGSHTRSAAADMRNNEEVADKAETYNFLKGSVPINDIIVAFWLHS